MKSVLESHPAVGQAAVLTASATGSAGGAAFWVPAATATVLPSAEDLRSFCAGRLGTGTAPEVFIALGALPMAGDNDVDEAALRALLPVAAPSSGSSRKHWTDIERSVAEQWEAVLAHDTFDVGDGFFDVGGNSHRVVELHLRLEERWPGALRVGQLFDLVTIEAQAAAISSLTSTAEAAAPVTFEF